MFDSQREQTTLGAAQQQDQSFLPTFSVFAGTSAQTFHRFGGIFLFVHLGWLQKLKIPESKG